MSIANVATGDLGQKIAQCKKYMTGSDTDPLIAAPHIAEIIKNWDEVYKKDVPKGLTCDKLLIQEFGPGRHAAFFLRRANAVEVLGEACRRWCHHDFAVWLCNKTTDRKLLDLIVRESILFVKLRNYNNPIKKSQGTRLALKIMRGAEELSSAAE